MDAQGRARSGGLAVNQQTVVLSVWLGIAALAIIYASLNLWHVRHLLKELRQGVHVPQSRWASPDHGEDASSVRAP